MATRFSALAALFAVPLFGFLVAEALLEFVRHPPDDVYVLRSMALCAAALGFFLLVGIRTAGIVAQNSRTLLALVFGPGLYVTIAILVCLVIVHAAIAVMALYLGEVALANRVHGGSMAAIIIGAVAGVVAMCRGAFSIIQRARSFVIGYPLSREQAPALWKIVDDTAARLQSFKPDALVAGLDPTFFVTEADVVCLDGLLKGRTLYCSLPLCRILSISEFTAVIGHELAHFKGLDTKFSRRFYPIYRGTQTSLSSLAGAGGEGFGQLALQPAIAALRYFLECFSAAERSISRGREFAADQAGASITDYTAIAIALIKVHAFASYWNRIEAAVTKNLKEGGLFTNVSKIYAQLVLRNASDKDLTELSQAKLAHPTDSHPPLVARLKNLGCTIDMLALAAMNVAPSESAIALFTHADDQEEMVSKTYQLIVARRQGINLNVSNPSYFVAEAPNGKYVGLYTVEQIVELVGRKIIAPDFVATQAVGTYEHFLSAGGTGKWQPVKLMMPKTK